MPISVTPPEVLQWSMSNAYPLVLECPSDHRINFQRQFPQGSLSEI